MRSPSPGTRPPLPPATTSTRERARAAEDTSTPACSTTGALSCTVTGLSTGNAYYFVVEATNIAGFSAPSTELRTTPGVELPPAPTGLTATATTVNPSPGAGTVTLAWNASATATGYNVYGDDLGRRRHQHPGLTRGTAVRDRPHTGITYYFVVEATNIAASRPPPPNSGRPRGSNTGGAHG